MTIHMKVALETIDRQRRDVCEKWRKAEGSVERMYYEGQRVALEEFQSFLTKLMDIPR